MKKQTKMEMGKAMPITIAPRGIWRYGKTIKIMIVGGNIAYECKSEAMAKSDEIRLREYFANNDVVANEQGVKEALTKVFMNDPGNMNLGD